MKRIIACIIALVILFCALPRPPTIPAGFLQIGGIRSDICTTDVPDCDCCPPLWGGGIATTEADLSAVQVGDWATITLLDDTRLVLECAAIFPCVRVGSWLVCQYGLIRAEGDVIIYDKYKAYMFVRL